MMTDDKSIESPGCHSSRSSYSRNIPQVSKETRGGSRQDSRKPGTETANASKASVLAWHMSQTSNMVRKKTTRNEGTGKVRYLGVEHSGQHSSSRISDLRPLDFKSK